VVLGGEPTTMLTPKVDVGAGIVDAADDARGERVVRVGSQVVDGAAAVSVLDDRIAGPGGVALGLVADLHDRAVVVEVETRVDRADPDAAVFAGEGAVAADTLPHRMGGFPETP
jgi:predicted ATP-grasp superfamily ATP-dependent carboligase